LFVVGEAQPVDSLRAVLSIDLQPLTDEIVAERFSRAE